MFSPKAQAYQQQKKSIYIKDIQKRLTIHMEKSVAYKWNQLLTKKKK